MEVFGLQYGEGSVCKFNDSDDALSLIEGRLPDDDELPNVSALQKHSSGYLEISTYDGLQYDSRVLRLGRLAVIPS